jgi:hypothetical protein
MVIYFVIEQNFDLNLVIKNLKIKNTGNGCRDYNDNAV